MNTIIKKENEAKKEEKYQERYARNVHQYLSGIIPRKTKGRHIRKNHNVRNEDVQSRTRLIMLMMMIMMMMGSRLC